MDVRVPPSFIVVYNTHFKSMKLSFDLVFKLQDSYRLLINEGYFDFDVALAEWVLIMKESLTLPPVGVDALVAIRDELRILRNDIRHEFSRLRFELPNR